MENSAYKMITKISLFSCEKLTTYRKEKIVLEINLGSPISAAFPIKCDSKLRIKKIKKHRERNISLKAEFSGHLFWFILCGQHKIKSKTQLLSLWVSLS